MLNRNMPRLTVSSPVVAASNDQGAEAAPSQARAGAADPSTSGERITVESGLFEHGYEAGKKSGRTSPDPAVENALLEFAGESAQRLAAAPFCPQANVADAEAQRDYDRLLATLDEVADQSANARADMHEREATLAALGDAPEAPKPPILTGLFGVCGISATLMFSIYDLFFARIIPDRVQGLVLGWLFGALLAALVTWTILSGASHEGAQRRHFAGVALGVFFGLAVLLLRVSQVQGHSENLMAWGLALLEVVAVIAVDLFAAGLRQGWTTYRARITPYRAAEADLAFARQRLADRLAAIQALGVRKQAFLEELRLRENSVHSAKAARAAAERAVTTGYRLAVEHNRGRLRGAEQRATKGSTLGLGATPSGDDNITLA